MNTQPSKRLVIAGASGAIGENLVREAIDKGYSITALSRSSRKSSDGIQWVQWTNNPSDAWAETLNGAFAVINLSGTSVIGKRWSPEFKKELLESRLSTTKALVEAIRQTEVKPSVFISGSAVGFYGDRGQEWVDETDENSHDFLGGMAAAWEATAKTAMTAGVRTVLLRTGVVLDKNHGALAQLHLPFRLGLGGPLLPGSQYMSWIHKDDETGLILHAIENTAVAGPLNAVAPSPVTNREFSKELASVLHRPFLFPVPGFALKILLGEVADMLTTGQRVRCKVATDTGYQFRFPVLRGALENLLTS